MRRWIGLSLPFCALLAACADDYVGKPIPDGGAADGGGGGGGGGGGDLTLAKRTCETAFSFDPGRSIGKVAIAGEWNGWKTDATPMTGPDASGKYSAQVMLMPGAHAYKLVVDGTDWQFDPRNPYRKYVGGVENSVVEVDDCNAPRIAFVKLDKSADGSLRAEARLEGPADGTAVARGDVEVLLDGAAAGTVGDDGHITVTASGLAKNKHRVTVRAKDRMGRTAKELVVPFWIEETPFDFRDGLMYFVFTDRFRDGTTGNTQPAGDVDARANYAGGDFAGVTQAIESGYFDSLGVRTLWLSPPNANPDHSEIGMGGYKYTGYHGYWPTAGREVQKRFGDLAALKALVAAAHAHGIRVIVDSVLNHVHSEHPYWQMHKNDGWFFGSGGCVCGGPGCDWNAHALDCWFQPYMPDVNYENWDAQVAMIDDALFWVRECDIDGFRVDAVKHFQRAATRRLRAKLRDDFEHAGPLFYLVGETFDGDRGLIKSFMGGDLLHAQFDFPLYFALRDALAYYSTSMRTLDQAVRDSEDVFGAAPMSPFIGNHDVARFLTMAAGMLASDPLQQAWNAPPGAPPNEDAYFKQRLALTFTATQPGVPLVYYGDEFGLPGAGDPDNRRFMKWSGYSGYEQATIDHVKRLGAARAELVALRRGTRVTMWIDDDVLVHARVAGQSVVVVAINRAFSARSIQVPVHAQAQIADGAVLKDRLGGPNVTVGGQSLSLNLPAHSSAALAP
jgi:glycosidase